MTDIYVIEQHLFKQFPPKNILFPNLLTISDNKKKKEGKNPFRKGQRVADKLVSSFNDLPGRRNSYFSNYVGDKNIFMHYLRHVLS